METTKALLIGNTERRLFSRMLDLGVDAKMAKKIMSFWMFLESKGFKDIYKNIIIADNTFLRCICAEAEVALAFFESKGNQVKSTLSISCPITWKLAGPKLSATEIFGDREKVSNDILAIQDKFCDIGGIDGMADATDTKGKVVDDPHIKDKRTSENCREIHASKLNPFAEEWKPASENERSLFMTFSRGRPISRTQIVNYFERKYGHCVEDVFIHKPQDREPEFGKIVFKFSWAVNLVLQENESVMIYIGQKTICLKKFKSF